MRYPDGGGLTPAARAKREQASWDYPAGIERYAFADRGLRNRTRTLTGYRSHVSPDHRHYLGGRPDPVPFGGRLSTAETLGPPTASATDDHGLDGRPAHDAELRRNALTFNFRRMVPRPHHPLDDVTRGAA
jgi:hypothetical protein